MIGLKQAPVEPFLLDLWRMKLHCPWCQLRMAFEASTTIHTLLSKVSEHVREKHPEKHAGTPIGFLIAAPNP